MTAPSILRTCERGPIKSFTAGTLSTVSRRLASDRRGASQLNEGESLQTLAEDVHFSKQGELRDKRGQIVSLRTNSTQPHLDLPRYLYGLTESFLDDARIKSVPRFLEAISDYNSIQYHADPSCPASHCNFKDCAFKATGSQGVFLDGQAKQGFDSFLQHCRGSAV